MVSVCLMGFALREKSWESCLSRILSRLSKLISSTPILCNTLSLAISLSLCEIELFAISCCLSFSAEFGFRFMMIKEGNRNKLIEKSRLFWIYWWTYGNRVALNTHNDDVLIEDIYDFPDSIRKRIDFWMRICWVGHPFIFCPVCKQNNRNCIITTWYYCSGESVWWIFYS